MRTQKSPILMIAAAVLLWAITPLTGISLDNGPNVTDSHLLNYSSSKGFNLSKVNDLISELSLPAAMEASLRQKATELSHTNTSNNDTSAYLGEPYESQDLYNLDDLGQIVKSLNLPYETQAELLQRAFIAKKREQERNKAKEELAQAESDRSRNSSAGYGEAAFRAAIIAATIAAAVYVCYNMPPMKTVSEKGHKKAAAIEAGVRKHLPSRWTNWLLGPETIFPKGPTSEQLVEKIAARAGVENFAETLNDSSSMFLKAQYDSGSKAKVILTIRNNWKGPDLMGLTSPAVASGQLNIGQIVAETPLNAEAASALSTEETEALREKAADAVRKMAAGALTNEGAGAVREKAADALSTAPYDPWVMTKTFTKQTHVIIESEEEWDALIKTGLIKDLFVKKPTWTEVAKSGFVEKDKNQIPYADAFKYVTATNTGAIKDKIEAIGAGLSQAKDAAASTAGAYFAYSNITGISSAAIAIVYATSQTVSAAGSGVKYLFSQPSALYYVIRATNAENNRLSKIIDAHTQFLKNYQPSTQLESFEVAYIRKKYLLDPNIATLIEHHLTICRQDPQHFAKTNWLLSLALNLPLTSNKPVEVDQDDFAHNFRHYSEEIRDYLASFINHYIIESNHLAKGDIHRLISQPLYFEGPPGVGKTEAVKRIGKVLNIPIARVNFHGASVEDLIGTSINSATPRPGRIIEAFLAASQGSTSSFVKMIFFIDDFDKLPPEISSFLLDLLEKRAKGFFSPFFNTTIKLPSIIILAGNKSMKDTYFETGVTSVYFGGYSEETKTKIIFEDILPQAVSDLNIDSFKLPSGYFFGPKNETYAWLKKYQDSKFDKQHVPQELVDSIDHIIGASEGDPGIRISEKRIIRLLEDALKKDLPTKKKK